MPLKLNSAGGGSVTIDTPSTASNFTLTVPAANGQVQVQNAMPAFSAYQSTQQTLSANTYTKLNFQTEDYDTNSNFDTTNMRFTPTVAGYYILTGGFNGASGNVNQLALYRNGSFSKYMANGSQGGLWGSIQVFANGSTDYFELFGFSTLGQALNSPGQQLIYFQGAMVRAA